MPTQRFPAPFALASGLALAAVALARPASADPACDASFLALEEGAVWEYEREVPEDGEQALGEADLALKLPTELTVEVKEIAEDGDDTVVVLREVFGTIEQTPEIRCTGEGIVVSPHSFLSVGEPGGGVGMELEERDRRGPSYPDGLRPGARWSSWVESEFQQTAAEGTGAEHPSGEIQIERDMVALGRVSLELDDDRTFRPFRVDFELEGRAMVEPALDRAVEIPADAQGALWFQPGVGLVRAVNRYGHDWTLANHETPDD